MKRRLRKEHGNLCFSIYHAQGLLKCMVLNAINFNMPHVTRSVIFMVGWAKMLTCWVLPSPLLLWWEQNQQRHLFYLLHTMVKMSPENLQTLCIMETALASRRNIKCIFDTISVMALTLLPEIIEKIMSAAVSVVTVNDLSSFSSDFTTSHQDDSSCHAKYLQ